MSYLRFARSPCRACVPFGLKSQSKCFVFPVRCRVLPVYRHASACRWGDHKAGGRCWLHLEINRIIHVLGTIIRKKGLLAKAIGLLLAPRRYFSMNLLDGRKERNLLCPDKERRNLLPPFHFMVYSFRLAAWDLYMCHPTERSLCYTSCGELA